MTLGSIAHAINAAAVEINPSIKTGVLCLAAARHRPAMPPISKPPTFERTSIGSEGSGLLTPKAVFITLIFFSTPLLSKPVPLPVTLLKSAPVKHAIIALLGVVLAMPMSPVATISIPLRSSSLNTSIPASRDFIACSRDIAGPRAILPVPYPTFFIFKPSTGSKSAFTPQSTITTLAPTCCAKMLIVAPPSRKFLTICLVTSCGKALTPSQETP